MADLQTRLLDTGSFRPLHEFVSCNHGIANPPHDALLKPPYPATGVPHSAKILIQGKDISTFHCVWGGIWVDYGKVQKAAKKKGSIVRPRDPAIFEAPCKLLVRESGSTIRACLDFERRYADNGVIVCQPKAATCSTIFFHFILGYLNSEIGSFWYRLVNPQDPDVLPKLKQKELERLWVPLDIEEGEMVQTAVLSHRIASTMRSGYIPFDDQRIVEMRRLLLVRLARLLDLSEKEVNVILDFVDEPHSVCERPFRYPRRIPDVPFIELPDRPLDQKRSGQLWNGLPLSAQEQRTKHDWEDIINGPLPDIYEHVPDEEDLRLGRELKAFADRLEKIERLLKGEAEA
jgi:hypothetical protein